MNLSNLFLQNKIENNENINIIIIINNSNNNNDDDDNNICREI